MPVIGKKKKELEVQIAQAFRNAKNKGSRDGANSEAVIQSLANEIAAAIEMYAMSLDVRVTVNPGQGVAGGVTTTPGSGQS
jgi:hypothetical protein